MARFLSSELLYDAATKFRDRCLLDDKSLFWPEHKAWTLETLKELQRRLVDTAIEGTDKTFMQKLDIEMQGASQEVFMILADIFYIYSVAGKGVKPATKKIWIEAIANSGGLSLPGDNDAIWQPLSQGIVNYGQKYNRKYEQFLLVIVFAQYFKQEKNLVWERHEIQRLIDKANEYVKTLTVTASDIRSLLLHLWFPEFYEDIISDRDKAKIVQFYKGRIAGPVPIEIDDAIYEIRKSLSKENDKENVPFQFYRDLAADWQVPEGYGEHGRAEKKIRDEKEPEKPDSSELLRILKVLKHTKNIVFYGPPGTGKTYMAKKAAEALLANQPKSIISPIMEFQDIVQELPMYDLIALVLYGKDKKRFLSVSQIEASELIAARYLLRPVKAKHEVIWSYLQTHTDPSSPNVHMARSSQPYLFQKNDASEWGLTGDGMKYVLENLPTELASITSRKTDESRDLGRYIFWSAFHQSYSYEEFIEGLRPKTAEDDPSAVVYEVELGTFRKVCAIANADPDNKYILIIDEINRGNISKIFGELITLIEDDKRLGAKNGLSLTLPYSGDTFGVPNNLYIIGTMNTSDRSIALLDVALRRRFAFIEMLPQTQLVADIDVEVEGAHVNLGDVLNYLNERISIDIDRNHQIGHSYFLTLSETPSQEWLDILEYVWNYQIIPLLEEYYYNHMDKLVEILFPFEAEQTGEISDESSHGTVKEIARQSGEDLVFALQAMLAKGAQREISQ